MSNVPPKDSPVAAGLSSASVPAASPGTFVELADIYEQRGEPKMRDRFLILAADAAHAAGQAQEADRLLQRLLLGSPHHLFKAYHSFEEALRADAVRTYLSDLRQNYPPDIVENLLWTLRGGTGPAPTAAPAPAAPRPAPRPAPIPSLELPTQTQPQTLPAHPKPTPNGTEPSTARQPAEPPRAAKPPARPAPGAAPAAPAPQPKAQPAPTARPVAVPAPPQAQPPAVPMPARPASARKAPTQKTDPTQPDPETGTGGWLGMVLFLVVCLLGLVLAAFSLARPFLPKGWLP